MEARRTDEDTLMRDSLAVMPAGVQIGTLASVEGGVRVVVLGTSGWAPVPARSVLALGPKDVGRQAVLAFEDGDPQRPIVLGLLQASLVQPKEESSSEEVQLSARMDTSARDVQVDGRAVQIEAERELVLACGKSSITLRASGEVVIKGLKITSRARQANKIKGGNVLIN